MIHPIATGFAILASASLAMAGGDGEKKGEGKKPETPASATQDRMPQERMPAADKTALTVKASPGKGITFDMGEQFRLRLKNRIQVQWRYLDLDGDANAIVPGAGSDVHTFRMRRVRTSFDGHVWNPTIQYKLQMDWTDGGMAGTALKDAWVRWEFWKSENQDTLALRAGQQKTMFGREATGSSEFLEFVDRSVATATFANSRSRGAIVEGSHSAGQFSWVAGIFNTSTAGASAFAFEEASNGDNELNYTFNLRWDPNGPMGWESYSQGDLNRGEPLFSLGAGGWWGNERASAGGPVQDFEAWMVNVNGAAKWEGWHVLAEGFLRNEDLRGPGVPIADSSQWGAQGQISYTLMPAVEDGPQWAFGGRYGTVKNDDTPLVLTGNSLLGGEGRINEYSAMVSAYYHEHQLKTQFTYTFQDVDFVGLSPFNNHILELQFQLVF